MKGIIFILTNDFIPDLVFIDIAPDKDGVKERVQQIAGIDAVPASFAIYYAGALDDSEGTKEKLFKGLEHFRIGTKNFFRFSPEKVKDLLQMGSSEEVFIKIDLDDDIKESQRPVFRFSMVDIQPGAELLFSRDPSITAVVENDRQIRFEGKITSLSGSALEILKRLCNISYNHVNGTNYWMYAGETLDERRRRIWDGEV